MTATKNTRTSQRAQPVTQEPTESKAAAEVDFSHRNCNSKLREFKATSNKMNQASNQELRLSECDFSCNDESFQSLIEVLQDNDLCPEVVDLSATKFSSSSDFLQVLDTFQTNDKVQELKLANFLCSDYLDDTKGSLQRLLSSNKTLQKLDLSGHSLNHAAVVDLTEGLKQNTTLLELKLHSCCLDETSAAWVLQSTSNLRYLDIGANNNLSAAFLNSHIAELLRTSRLETFILDHCSELFAVENVSQLTPFLEALRTNTSLKSLSLRFCRIQEQVGEALFRALTVNTTLTSLNLEFAGFGLRDKGGEILLRYLPQFQALKELKLIVRYRCPKVTDRLLRAVAANSSLERFFPRVDDFQAQQKLKDLLERNQRSAQAQTLLNPCVSPAILPEALSQLARSPPGSAASFQVIQHWIAECI